MSDFDYLLEDLEDIKKDFIELDREIKKAFPTLVDLELAIARVEMALVNLRAQKSNIPQLTNQVVNELTHSFSTFVAVDILLEELLVAVEGTEYAEEPFGEYLLEKSASISDNARSGGIRVQQAGTGFRTQLSATVLPNDLFGDIEAWANVVSTVRGEKLGDPIRASKRWAAAWNSNRDVWTSIQSARLGLLSSDTPLPFWSILDGGSVNAEMMSSTYGGYPTPITAPKRFINRAERRIKKEFTTALASAESTFNSYVVKLDEGIRFLEELLERLRSSGFVDGPIYDSEPTAQEIRNALQDVIPDIQLASDDRVLQAYRDVKQTGDIVNLSTTKDGRVELTGDYSLKRVRVSKLKLVRALGAIR